MILDLVKQAVRIKMTCKFPSPIISEAEFCYASAYALREMNQNQLLEEAAKKQTIHELRQLVLPVLEQHQSRFEENPPMKRLIQILTASKAEGEITEEIRALIQ